MITCRVLCTTNIGERYTIGMLVESVNGCAWGKFLNNHRTKSR